jgi:hypothetical protein
MTDMRIAVDLNEATLEQILKYTGGSKKSPAIAQVVNEFVRRQKAKEFGSLIMEGAFDYPCSPEEIQQLDR